MTQNAGGACQIIDKPDVIATQRAAKWHVAITELNLEAMLVVVRIFFLAMPILPMLLILIMYWVGTCFCLPNIDVGIQQCDWLAFIKAQIHHCRI